MSDYDYSKQGLLAEILPGATKAIKELDWVANDWSDDINFDGMVGEIEFEFGAGSSSHHIALKLHGEPEPVGFPPEYIAFYVPMKI
jgi:hypothetical protein